MKILLISGHGAGDSGAVGCGHKEADLTRTATNILAGKLAAYDVSVSRYPVARDAYQDNINGSLAVHLDGYDLVIEVHFNDYNGDAYGTECLYKPSGMKTLASKVSAAIAGALTVGGADVPNCEHTVSSGSGYRYDFYKYSNGLLMIALYWGGTTTHYTQSLGGYGRYVSFNWGADHAFNGLGYACFHTWKVGSGFAEPAGMIKQSANAVNLYCVTNTTGEQSTEINMLCVGRWK